MSDELKRICFIPMRANDNLTLQAIKSLYDQIDEFFILNNSCKALRNELEYDPKITVYDPMTPQCYEQSLNIAARWVHEINCPYFIWAHNDIIAKPEVVDLLFKKYDQVKKHKWGVIYSRYDTLCLFNPDFFYKENLWGDVNLFPDYYGDNNRYRLMDLRGWRRYNTEGTEELVEHLGSQTIKQNPDRNLINNLTYDLRAILYARIWGGAPGHETITDPTANGLFK